MEPWNKSRQQSVSSSISAVDAATVVKDKLWANYQDWWHGEMKLLTPVLQAQCLMALVKWWARVMGGHHGMEKAKKGH